MSVHMKLIPPWYRHYFTPHPWQREALEAALASIQEGKLGVVRAATGSGKSIVQTELAFCFHKTIPKTHRIVITVPKQRLVNQMYDDMQRRMPGRVRKWYQHERKLDRPVIVACGPSLLGGTSRCLTCDPVGPVEARERRRKKLPLVHLQGRMLQAAILSRRCGHTEMVYDPDDSGLAVQMLRRGLRTFLWIADEVHRTEVLSVMSWVHAAQPISRIGFTATPFRASENERISLFEEEIYSYGIEEALKDGVVVQPRVIPYMGVAGDVDQASYEMIRDAKGPGIINSWNIEDAEYYADYLRARGFYALAIHSKLSPDEQKHRLYLLKRGKIRALVHVNLLSEGVNFPFLHWICLRRSSRRVNEETGEEYHSMSRTRFIQEVGRVLRAHKPSGKKEAIVYDPNGLFDQLELSYEALLGSDEDFELVVPEPVVQTQKENKPETNKRLSIRNPIVRWIARYAHYAKQKRMVPWQPEGDQNADPDKEQFALMEKALPGAAKARMDKDFRAKLKKAVGFAANKNLSKGQVHDLICILVVLNKYKGFPRF